MSDLIINLTDSTLDDVLKQSSQPVLLDLWAPWCAPCLAIAPLLEKVAAATAGQLTVAKLDVQEYEALMARFRARSIPTLLLFRDGNEVARKVGVESLSDLNSWLRTQGIAIEAEGEVVLPETQPWPSFYGDEALLRFLTDRLKTKAQAGEVAPYDYPRPEGLLTAPYVLAGQESLDVFERVTGLPPVLALWLEYFDYVTPQQVEALAAALAAGKNYGDVPLHLLANWLIAESDSLQALLPAPLNALCQQWLALTQRYLNGEATPRQEWLSLQQQASEFDELYANGRDLCALLFILSPPSALHDAQTSMAILYHWRECLHSLEKIKAGWSGDDFQMADRRWAWIEPQLEGVAEEALEEKVESLRQQWPQQAPEFAAYVEKEARFYDNLSELTTQLMPPLQAQFLQLLKQAPDSL